MLFDQFPWWLIAVILSVCFLMKHVAMGRIEHSGWYAEKIDSPGFLKMLTAIALLQGALTFAIVFLFVGVWGSLMLGIIDAALSVVVGYCTAKNSSLQRPQDVFERTCMKIRAFYLLLYSGFIAVTIEIRATFN